MNHLRLSVAALASTKPSVYVDHEFGEIHYRRVPSSRYVRIRMSEKGVFKASLPMRAPVSSLAALIESSREQLRGYVSAVPQTTYQDGQRIGQSHKLRFVISRGTKKVVVSGQEIVIGLPLDADPESQSVQALIRDGVLKALRVEAKAYLPRRLSYLAEQYGFNYDRLRFAHQSSRWGSCSSHGTISLNIALMNLPFEIIDYVLIHELSHTRHMNHSPEFWREVEAACPGYKTARKSLKGYNPHA